jgi:small subunit ribosomal protein S6
MTLYETTFIVRQDTSTSEVENITKSIKSIVEVDGGKVLKEEYWGLRDMAYEIKKNKKGHYVMLILEASHRTMQEIQRKVKLSEDIIRNLTIKLEVFNPNSSLMMASDSEGTHAHAHS